MKRSATKGARSNETRERLLETAGEIFADKGYERTTAKEIAARAGVNAAAVNYHFGGVDELYLAVIEEARNRAYTVDRLSKVVAGIRDPLEKLRAILDHMVQLAVGPFSSSWMARLFAREMASPSKLFGRTNWRDSERRFALMREIIAEYLGASADHPDVDHACWSMTAPVTLLLNADRKRFAQLFPRVDLDPGQAAAITEQLACYALGGLAAARARRKKKARPKT